MNRNRLENRKDKAMGRGTSKAAGGSARKKTTNAVRGIALLQGAVGKARTDLLMQAYNMVNRKRLQDMTNEEKMVRAVATDELAKRGALVYDPKDESFHKNTGKGTIIYDPERERSYRINGIRVEHYGTEKGITVAIADYYYNGKWHVVRNDHIRAELAKKARRRR